MTSLPSGTTAAVRIAELLRTHRFADAATALRMLTAREPQDWRTWLNLGHVSRTLGAIDEAAAAYRRALAIVPASGTAWWGLANLKAARFAAPDVDAMLEAIAVTADPVPLHFALAAALDQFDATKAAFQHLQIGNALQWAQAAYDADRASAGFRQAEAVLTSELPRAPTAPRGRGPVFIVGLPRSGSSLVEQMLASHPAIEGLGELHALNQALRPLATPYGYLDRLAGAPFAELGGRYLTGIQRLRTTDRPLFTDKMPSNWVYAGVIPLILPGARIIDVKREAMACGFANYGQFYAHGNDWTYDLTAIGRFTADYVQHMAHVDRIAPGAVHRVIFENLIDQPEVELRRLLAYLDLPYDAACLRFHETARTIGTPSSAQVRQPIMRDRAGRWCRYERWLEPLRTALQ